MIALAAWLWNPCAGAAVIASLLTGWPADDLRRLARRESHCTAVGVHERDGWAAARMMRRGTAAGCVPADTAHEARQWGVRGAYGAAPAYAWCSLPTWARRLPPQAMDMPPIAAVIVAVRRADLSRRYRCGTDTTRCLRRLWAGVGQRGND